MKDDCIFCKLANGVFPTNSIYEDEDFNVILDASPATKGHALILPKEHYDNVYEMPDALLEKTIKLAKKIIQKETDVLGCDGYNIVQNNGEAAGQTVFHFHMHLIPRYKEKNMPMVTWKPNELPEEEMKDICRRMKL
ncbi:MAG: HIT family protein [Agathobacter sp.]|nr:HIT family protein [Agathobacter sp.]